MRAWKRISNESRGELAYPEDETLEQKEDGLLLSRTDVKFCVPDLYLDLCFSHDTNPLMSRSCSLSTAVRASPVVRDVKMPCMNVAY